MKKKYKQTYKSKRQDYRKGGRVQKAKGGVNTRRAEPDDRSIGKKVTKPVNKPTEPTVTRGAGGGPNFNKPPKGSTGSSVLPGQAINKGPKPVREQPISIGGVGGGRRMTGREELGLANESVSDNQIIPNVSTGTSQTRQPARPSPRMEREIELQNMAGKQ